MRGLRWTLREMGGFAHAWALCMMSGVRAPRPHKVLLCERFCDESCEAARVHMRGGSFAHA